jgi:hypothetical protein
MKSLKKKHVHTALVYLYLIIVSILILMPLAMTLSRAIFTQSEEGKLAISIEPYFTISEGFWDKMQVSISISLGARPLTR